MLKVKKIFQKFFKSLTYKIYKLIYGEINGVINPNNDSRIKKINFEIDEIDYNIFIVQNSRLYTDRVHDAAVVLDNKIIDEASYQLRVKSGDATSARNNSNVKNNIVFKNGTPRFLKKVKGNVVSLLSGGGSNKNYFHWLYDVLPRIGILEKQNLLNQINFFLLPNTKEKFQKETLSLLNFSDEKILDSSTYRHISCEKLFITNHPYCLTNDAHEDAQNIPTWICQWLKSKFLKNKKEKNYPKKIYIDRGDNIFGRHIINKNQIEDILKKKQYYFIKLENLSFREQVEIFNNASNIIGLHGAGFANLSFCRPETRILEIKTTLAGSVINNLAKKNNLNYESIECESKDNNVGVQQGSIEVPIEELLRKLD